MTDTDLTKRVRDEQICHECGGVGERWSVSVDHYATTTSGPHTCENCRRMTCRDCGGAVDAGERRCYDCALVVALPGLPGPVVAKFLDEVFAAGATCSSAASLSAVANAARTVGDLRARFVREWELQQLSVMVGG